MSWDAFKVYNKEIHKQQYKYTVSFIDNLLTTCSNLSLAMRYDRLRRHTNVLHSTAQFSHPTLYY